MENLSTHSQLLLFIFPSFINTNKIVEGRCTTSVLILHCWRSNWQGVVSLEGVWQNFCISFSARAKKIEDEYKINSILFIQIKPLKFSNIQYYLNAIKKNDEKRHRTFALIEFLNSIKKPWHINFPWLYQANSWLHFVFPDVWQRFDGQRRCLPSRACMQQ